MTAVIETLIYGYNYPARGTRPGVVPKVRDIKLGPGNLEFKSNACAPSAPPDSSRHASQVSTHGALLFVHQEMREPRK